MNTIGSASSCSSYMSMQTSTRPAQQSATGDDENPLQISAPANNTDSKSATLPAGLMASNDNEQNDGSALLNQFAQKGDNMFRYMCSV